MTMAVQEGLQGVVAAATALSEPPRSSRLPNRAEHAELRILGGRPTPRHLRKSNRYWFIGWSLAELRQDAGMGELFHGRAEARRVGRGGWGWTRAGFSSMLRRL